MYYIIYKTTNLVNNKIYIGKHKTDTLDFDGYYGSGLYLNRAIKKYGTKNFIRETLHIFDNEIDCSNKERELVNENFINSDDVYNISIGGTGGNTLFGYDEEYKQSIIKKRGEAVKKGLSNMDEETRNGFRERMKKHRIQPDNKNRKHKGQALENIINANHMRNKTWYTDGINNITLKENEDIPYGYYKGRTIENDKKFKGHNKDTLNKMSENRNGGNYYNNGIKNIYICDGDLIPDGYIKGMKSRNKKEKYSWFTNGVENIGLYEGDEVPNGYYKGRTLKRKIKDNRNEKQL